MLFPCSGISLETVQKALISFRNRVLPPACLFCGSPLSDKGEPFCVSCLERLADSVVRCPCCALPVGSKGVQPHLCQSCQSGVSLMGTSCALGGYSGVLKEMVQQFKYSGRFYLDKPLARLLADKVVPGSCDLIVAVPLYEQRQRKRGYNQAALLAGKMGGWLDVPVNPHLLIRSRKTISQQGLNRAERLQNVKGAFSVSGEVVMKRILLVDDVMTTGATVNECCRVLLKAGADQVDVAVIATA